MDKVSFFYAELLRVAASHNVKLSDNVLLVSIGEQKLWHLLRGNLLASYSVSTSKRPPSCIADSLGTPNGLHCVADKIGDGAPIGMVFRARKPIGKCYWDLSEEENTPNLVTTRILRLKGLEPGKNSGPVCDTFDRFVYIHGTNHEDRIGSPDTAGCIALRNQEVITLFDSTPEGTLLWLGLE